MKLRLLGSATIPKICTAFDQLDSNYTILYWNEYKMCNSKVIGYCECVVAMHIYACTYVQAIKNVCLLSVEKALTTPLPL